MSNAERQKRYRDNKRNADRNVTGENVTVTPDRNAPVIGKPGDPDYNGCCYQDEDGNWQVRKDETDPKHMSRQRIQAKIDSYPGDSWKGSPEYKELMRRLHKYSIDRLESEGYAIPAWKAKVAV